MHGQCCHAITVKAESTSHNYKSKDCHAVLKARAKTTGCVSRNVLHKVSVTIEEIYPLIKKKIA